ncbi:MAG: glycosyltransferase family 39 protein [Deltaproteobacteria bacterium]|nr:glycosyltransferase family 39 protein [Deltaproteobacteria bacterium]
MEVSKIKNWLLPAIFILALFVRLAYLYQVEPIPFSDTLTIDAKDEDSWGREIAAGDWVGKEKGVFYRDPLYAYLLGTTYAVFGHKLWLIRVIQAVIDSTTCLLLYFLGRMIFNPAVGLTTALLSSLYGPFIWYQGLIEKTTLMIFLTTLFLLATLRAIETPGKRQWFLSGLTLGLAVMTRGNMLIFAPAIIMFYLLSEKKLSSFPRRLILMSIFFAGLMTVLIPVAVRNLVYGKAFVLTVPSIGLNFYIGNNPSAVGIHTPIPSLRTIPEKEAEDAASIASMAVGKVLTPSEVSSFWLNKGVAFAEQEPDKFIILLGRKVLLFWNHYEVPDVYNYYFFRDMIPMLNLFLTFGIIAPLGIAGILISFKEFKKGRVVSGFIIIYMASLVLFYITSRYRLPGALMLLPFASYTLVFIINSMRTQAYKKLLLTAVVLVPATLVVNMNILDERKLLSQSHSSMGDIYQQRGGFKEAIAEYQASLKLDPHNWDSANNLAYLYARNGTRLEEALNLVQGALARNPGSPEMLDTLSLVYLKMGRVAEAKESILKAIARDPRNSELSERLLEIEENLR